MSGDGKSVAQLSVVGELAEPTHEDVEGILGEMIDRGIQISMEDALASSSLVARAKAIFRVREQKRMKEAEERVKKEAEVAQRAEEARRKRLEQAAEVELQRMLEVETAKPVPSEAIATFVEATREKSVSTKTVVARPPVINISAVVSHELDGITVVDPMETVKQKYGSQLLALVFTAWQYAAAFRGWLAKYKKLVLDALTVERQKLSVEQDADYIKTLEARIGRFDELFTMINEVIENGWAKNPKKDMAAFSFFAKIEDACNGTRFEQLREVPRRLTAKEKQRQADEAKAREAAIKARGACQTDMVARLINVGFTKEDSEKMANAWLRKWDGDKATDVLIAKAVNFAIAGEGEKAAKVACATGLEPDVFDALVGAKKAELAEAAAKQAAQAVVNRGLQAGSMLPRVQPKSKKDKGGKKDNNKKNGGKEGRRR